MFFCETPILCGFAGVKKLGNFGNKFEPGEPLGRGEIILFLFYVQSE